ncbi:MAG: DUF3168 domain-containing protein [Pseudomonadota bacterium]
MSYAASSALQSAVFHLLSNDAALVALVGSAIHDEVPPGPVSGTLVSLGEGEVRDLSDASGGLGDHRIAVAVISDAEGFATAKAVAEAISDTLVGAAPALARGRVVSLSFVKAQARRVRAGQTRRIDMTFRAIVEDS